MKRGEVVQVYWPYTDFTGSKVRPAVVVQNDLLNGLLDDTVLVKITSKQFGLPGTEVSIDPTIETASGLSKKCHASCKDILTLDQGRIVGSIGVLSDAILQQIETCLKSVLEIR